MRVSIRGKVRLLPAAVLPGLNIMMIAELGCDRVVLPKVAAALSASGMQYANIVAEEAATLVTISNRFDFEKVKAFAELTGRLETFRRGLGERGSDCVIEYFAEARYLAQVWELDTPVPGGRFAGADDVAALVATFHEVHERVFAVRDEGSAVEVVNWKARLTARIHAHPTSAAKTSDRRSLRRPETASLVVRSRSRAVFKPSDILPGNLIVGPAIVEEPTTTLVIYPGMSAQVSDFGNYLLRVG